MSYIAAIGTAVPENRLSQATIASFMETMMDGDGNLNRKLRVVFGASGIEWRHSVLPDYGRTSGFTFYSDRSDDSFPGTKQRMEVYRHEAVPLSIAAIDNMLSGMNGSFNLSEVTHLVVVSCTGMYAPGLDIDLIHRLQLSTSVQRTCIQFMGCYAAFNAIKVANAFCKADANAKVLVVCTELCSLHFQREATDDNILANALFADGSAALLVQNNPGPNVSLQLEAFHTDIAREGENDMAWEVGDYGFTMKLSGYIPSLVSKGTAPVVKELLHKAGNGSRPKYFAIHPGGMRILNALEQMLDLSKEDNAVAYHVLQKYGNMSSVTIAFVLKELINRVKQDDDNAKVVALAFGPGLTMESVLMKISM